MTGESDDGRFPDDSAVLVRQEAGIDRLMTGWEPDQNPQLRRLLGRITTRLIAAAARCSMTRAWRQRPSWPAWMVDA
jgi:hypothetical protein